jgi:rhodanese-related sulfurtransferase/predicted metal-dependent enzyme (double-stranded beta helix superfamily)
MSVMQERHAAIGALIAKVRRIEAEDGATPQALDRIKPLLVALASRSELFPKDQFFTPGSDKGRIYRLAEDPDHRFALYASAGMPGKAQPPHNHTTWASIAGVYGQEHNVFYERIDNRSTPGQGSLRKTGELTVVKGNAVAFLPDDFHTIEVRGGEPSLHLHLYGMSLEHLPGRIRFESPAGGAYRTFPANPNIGTLQIPPQALKAMIRDGEELAILDVREEGQFARAHLLLAASLPLSHIELRAAALVPRASTRVVVADGDGGALAEKAARRLFDLGYANIAILGGGAEGWKQAGFELFSGVYVPSKAFGEIVEHGCGTPRIEAQELKKKIDAGDDLVILDSRPMDEFTRMSIPGGVDCPGAELVYRVHDMAPDPKTTVVVNCAGRTRSIIGAQSLINAGVPNKVMALKNGTMGWHLAGLKVARGETRHAPAPSTAGLAKAKERAQAVAQRFGVKRIGRGELARFQAESAQRTLYLFDVRTAEEYRAGHLKGARHAPGGQLVQATDTFAGARGARIVLADNDGVRATMTAHWLIQMGWRDVFVLDNALEGAVLETGPEPRRVLGNPGPCKTVAAAELNSLLQRGAAVTVDLDTSLNYKRVHIPGAWFAVRATLPQALAKLPAAGAVVVTSPDGVLAKFAAAELAAAAPGRDVLALEGGTEGWRAAGFGMETGEERWAEEPSDIWYKPYENEKAVEESMKAYLTWEVALVGQIERDGDAGFNLRR